MSVMEMSDDIYTTLVIPAKAGIQRRTTKVAGALVKASALFAGTTE